MRKIRYLQAYGEGLRQAMEADENVFVVGLNVRHSLRGITKGMVDIFGPNRIVDAPLSEAGFTGMATGAAMAGMRPVVEFEIPALAYIAYDQLVDQAAKIAHMTGGQCKVPVTYIFPGCGFRGGMAGQHTDNPYPALMQGGIKVCLPTTPRDAKGLLMTAIKCDDPVALFAPAPILALRGECEEEPFEIPLGKGNVQREGTDVTIIGVGELMPRVHEAAAELEKDGISVHIWDPRTLHPLDIEGMKEAVAKTGRVIIVDDSNRICGFGAEAAAVIAEVAFKELKAPVRRLCRATIPGPFSPTLEAGMRPTTPLIVKTAKALVKE